MADEISDYITHMKDEVYKKEYIDIYPLRNTPKNPLAQAIPLAHMTTQPENDPADFFGPKVTNFIILDGPYKNIETDSVNACKGHIAKVYENFGAYKTWVMINTEGEKFKCMSPTDQQALDTSLETACAGLSQYGIVYKGKMSPGAIKDFIFTELKELFGEPPR